MAIIQRCRCASLPVTSAISARMPPSPPLSARITNTQYFTETVISSAHTTSDSRPNAAPAPTFPPAAEMIVCMV